MLKVELRHLKDFHHWKKMSDGYFDIGFFANVVKTPKFKGYIGACRSGTGQLNDTVDIVKYDEQFNLVEKKTITPGEDPRTFIYNGKPYSLTWYPYADNNQIVLSYKLVDLLEEKVINLNIENFSPSPLMVLGKNWMPLVKNNQLYIVVSIDPDIHILHCDVETGNCSWITPIESIKNGLNVSISRGGTPFIFNKDLNLYVGLGHRSHTSYDHKPFFYALTEDFKSTIISEDIITGKNGVEDPQSIYEEDGKIYCCIGNWHVPNDGSVGLYELMLEY